MAEVTSTTKVFNINALAGGAKLVRTDSPLLHTNLCSGIACCDVHASPFVVRHVACSPICQYRSVGQDTSFTRRQR